MADPRLELAPHEKAPGRNAELDGELLEFRVLWNGMERGFTGQVVDQKWLPMIFFALVDEPHLGHFVSALKWGHGEDDRKAVRPVYEPRTHFRTEDAPEILKRSATVAWGRLYFLDDELNVAHDRPVRWRLFMALSGWGEWSAAPDFYWDSAIFRWHADEEEALSLALLPPRELLSQVRPALLRESSDAAFAREFALLSVSERHQKCRPLVRGSYQQWEWVVRLFIQSRVSVWRDGRRAYRISAEVNPTKNSPSAHVRFNTDFPAFFGWTHRYFEPTLDDKFVESCVAAQWWQKRKFRWSERIGCPTQHERLEALLQLRDWLADKATSEEIEALLSED